MKMPRGMRVILLDEDAEVRAKVRAAIEWDYGFVMAGESGEWPGCEILLDRFAPELLVARVKQVPSKFIENLSETEFPVLVGLRSGSNGFVSQVGLYDTLQVPPEAERVRSLLGRVRSEIYRRKADELSFLVERYVACSATGGTQYLSKLRVEDEGQIQEIEIEHVSLIVADGNYVRVHANNRTYEIRNTLTGIAAKLDTERFARVHRSFIVNLSHVLGVSMKDSSAAVTLNTGMEVPIGPNYREDFESIIRRHSRINIGC
jgi:two-component system, LytTR family, response regulator